MYGESRLVTLGISELVKYAQLTDQAFLDLHESFLCTPLHNMSSTAPPSITSAGSRSSSSDFGTATSSSLTSPSSSTLPLGLSAGAEAGIALGVIIAVLLLLILLVLSFFPYRRKQYHSKQSPGIACGELGYASIDAEKTAPSVPQRAARWGNAGPSGRAIGKEQGALTQHEQSEMPGVSIPVEQFVVAKGPMLKVEDLTDARSGRFEVCTARIQFA
jgi:hypothetical protein